MRQTYLHENWVFNNATPKPPYERSAVQYQTWLPAKVPGYVHLDLVKNKILGDPFDGMFELGSRWVDESDWVYKTEFSWQPDESNPKRLLQFEGLDTVAEVRLNGTVIGSFDNMFVPHEVDVSSQLMAGKNELEILFSSPVRIGELRRTAYFAEEGLAENLRNFDERAFVRKAQYMSAWDWGPRLASSGIWRPISLIEFSARVTSFTVFQQALESGAYRIYSKTEVDGTGQVTLTFGDVTLTSEAESIQELDLIVEAPELWWPNGMGKAHLYPASAKIEGGNEIIKKIGLRTITLDQKPDQFGESFTFVINGKKLWARGANWIPDDSFPSRVTPEQYRSQIHYCKTLGMNMLRVWGGGLYELEEFYDACDVAGILVWQDFTYGCSYYPDGDQSCEIAKAEAEYHVLRLRDRASHALWCGNNENLLMWQTKWGGELSPPRYYGEHIYDKSLPEVVSRLDPGKSYIASSPVGQDSNKAEANANDGGYGDSHYWDVWHGRGDWIHYRDSDTRFSSEFGFASSCSMSVWDTYRCEGAEDSPVIRWHDKTGKGWEKFLSYVTTHYPEPHGLNDWVYYSQLNQRDALRFGIEHWRRSTYCQGTLIWQFNDCWPVQSWAVQDYGRFLKPAGYELKRLYHDQLISLDKTDSGVEVHLVNDGAESWSGIATVEISSLHDGASLSSEDVNFNLESGERTLLATRTVESPRGALIRVTAGEQTATSLFAEPKDLDMTTPTYKVWLDELVLVVEVIGVAIDLVAWDPDSGSYLKPVGIPLPGVDAKTLVNGRASWTCESKPSKIRLRSLAGEITVAI